MCYKKHFKTLFEYTVIILLCLYKIANEGIYKQSDEYDVANILNKMDSGRFYFVAWLPWCQRHCSRTGLHDLSRLYWDFEDEWLVIIHVLSIILVVVNSSRPSDEYTMQ